MDKSEVSETESEGSNEDVDVCCDPCLTKDEQVEAEGFCENCQENLCAACLDYHPRTKASRHHKLLRCTKGDEEKKEDKLEASREGTCTIHVNEEIRFFCPEHEALGCNDCMTLGHRTCEIEYIPDKCVEMSKSHALINVISEIDIKLQDSAKIKQIAQDVKSENEVRLQNAFADMDKFYDYLIQRMEYLKQQLATEAEKQKVNLESSVEKVLSACSKFSSELNTIKSSILERENSKFDSQTFVAIKRAKSLMYSYDVRQQENDLNQRKAYFVFQHNQTVAHLLNSPDGLGWLNVTSVDQTVPRFQFVGQNYVTSGNNCQFPLNVVNPNQASFSPIRNVITPIRAPSSPPKPVSWTAIASVATRPNMTMPSISGPAPTHGPMQTVRMPAVPLGVSLQGPRHTVMIPSLSGGPLIHEQRSTVLHSSALISQTVQAPKENITIALASASPPVQKQRNVSVKPENPFSTPFTLSSLAAAPQQEQKQMLGERLFPLIQRMYPDLACKITGMLLEINNSELLHMLENSEFLKAKVEEAVAILQARLAKEAASNNCL